MVMAVPPVEDVPDQHIQHPIPQPHALCACCVGPSFARVGRCIDQTHEKRSKRRSLIDLRGLAFGAVMLASSALNNLFVTYHLEFFLGLVKLNSTWFYVGQLIFLVWNATNDLLFGWASDVGLFSKKGTARSRLPAIRFGGLFWAIAFLQAWFPWGTASPFLAGLNFTFNLCLYDGMLTLVEVNHGALLTELAVDSKERAHLNSWTAVCAAIGSLTSWCGHIFWSESSMRQFRLFALVVAAGAYALFEFAAYGLSREAAAANNNSTQTQKSTLADLTQEEIGEGEQAPLLSTMDRSSPTHKRHAQQHPTPHQPKPHRERSAAGFQQFIGELGSQRNFRVFVLVSALQTFDCAFGKNFFSFFLELLVGDAVSASTHGLLITASFLLPWVATFFISRALEKTNISLTSMLRLVWSGRLLLLVACLPLLLVDRPVLLGVAVLCNRVMSECVCRLVPLVESDLTDENMYLNHRSQSMSATIVGAANFISKPSQSFGPMVGYFLLTRSSSLDIGSLFLQAGPASLPLSELHTGRHNASFVLVGLPLLVVIVQLALWQWWTLDGRYLKNVKSYIRSAQSEHAPDV